MRRLTFRTRLTLLWGGLFLAAAAILLGLTYFLVNERLTGGDPPRMIGEATLPSAAASGPPPRGGLPEGAVGPGGVVGPAGGVGPPDQGGQKPNASEELEAMRREALRFEQATLRALLTQGAIALGVVALIGMAFGWLMAERALRPLHRITEAARRVADDNLTGVNLHERIALTGPSDEIKDLADTFDAMLERLDRAFDSQRRFVGNASHELRTPLAINRTLIEVALGRREVPSELRLLGDTLLAVNQRQERLLDGLLTLARSEQELTTHDPVDLAEVAAHVLDAPNGAVALHRDLAAAPTAGDPVLLERVVHGNCTHDGF